MQEKRDNSNSSPPLLPVILSGGSGTRLWPLSRECFPKQYLSLDEKSNFSLLQNTYLRLIGIRGLENPLIICNEEQRFLVAEQMREINVYPNSIILEPIGRNTAPAIALSALYAQEKYQDINLLILSADHLINDSKSFHETIEKGIFYSNQEDLVTFGIVPNSPETGYGYIEAKDALSKENISSKIEKFIEKPNRELAETLIKDKKYTWNSGIFLFKATTILKELKKYQPEIMESCKDIFLEMDKDFDFQRINEGKFATCPNKSIDVAIMEKTNRGRVLSLDAGWSDIGNWNSVWENSSKDVNGNFYKGKVIHKNSKNCYFRSEDRLIVGLDLENTIVIETNDAILVSNKNSTESLKNIVKNLEKKNFKEGKFNKKMYRPWGSYTCLIESESWQVKILEIKPFASLSLQLHHHRSEHWVVVNGTAKVEIDGLESTLVKNQSIFVPLGLKHRLSNPKNIPLEIIEVQNGVYLGEDDIERFDDQYGRT